MDCLLQNCSYRQHALQKLQFGSELHNPQIAAWVTTPACIVGIVQYCKRVNECTYVYNKTVAFYKIITIIVCLHCLIQFILQVLHKKIDFDSHDLGCMPYDRLFSSGMSHVLHVHNTCIYMSLHVRSTKVLLAFVDWTEPADVTQQNNRGFCPSADQAQSTTNYSTLSSIICTLC